MERQRFSPFLLSPFDHFFPPILFLSEVLYFPTQNKQGAIEDLQLGLSRLFKLVPCLTGVADYAHGSDKPNVVEVRPVSANEDTAPLVEIQHYPQYGLPATVNSDDRERGERDWSGAAGNESWRCLTPRFDETTVPAPVFSAQINVLADGVALGLVVNHMVFDGMGNGKIIDLFERCCRDPTTATSSFSFAAEVETRQSLHELGRTRTLPTVNNTSSAVKNEAKQQEQELVPGEGIVYDGTELNYSLIISDEQMRLLKSRCNARLPTIICSLGNEEKGQPKFVSSNDVLTALLWICNAWVQKKEQSSLGVAVNCRERFPKPLPNNYLGNSVAYANCTLSRSELQCLESWDKPHWQQSLCQEIIDNEPILDLLTLMAYRIRCRLFNLDADELGRLAASYYHTPDWSQILVQRCDILVSSLRTWNIFNLDFTPRLGPVQQFEFLPPTSPAGECLIKPARKDRNGNPVWEVMVALPAAEMEQLCRNPLLNWACSDKSPVSYLRSL
ncbi:hypothetical protein ASPBRDRAFT_36140 [Aspergillus brasiliensis CBS 101740]|uniref:Transferase n=1 Tax=Aspergillus brasiliensis (strain CBS 101740 / IMI 381727 / IBT 21946) TaxID=767769 RepID=A0A1L9UZ35_ASPBC|nr:hypothetical protein ASPBRDRAFT_36140 [Aspergillus brasiliensis CBS 101740]